MKKDRFEDHLSLTLWKSWHVDMLDILMYHLPHDPTVCWKKSWVLRKALADGVRSISIEQFELFYRSDLIENPRKGSRLQLTITRNLSKSLDKKVLELARAHARDKIKLKYPNRSLSRSTVARAAIRYWFSIAKPSSIMPVAHWIFEDYGRLDRRLDKCVSFRVTKLQSQQLERFRKTLSERGIEFTVDQIARHFLDKGLRVFDKAKLHALDFWEFLWPGHKLSAEVIQCRIPKRIDDTLRRIWAFQEVATQIYESTPPAGYDQYAWITRYILDLGLFPPEEYELPTEPNCLLCSLFHSDQ